MPLTYSINDNTPTESTRKSTVYSVLLDIPNNTQKLISPRDVRDAFLSAWANSAFKLTRASNTNDEYIGLDSGDPENPEKRDIKNKILIGKRNFGGTDVMTQDLLDSDFDTFFYNTKADNLDQTYTKIGILAGTNSSSHINAPFLQVRDTGTQFDLSIENPSGGDISIKSNSGNVFLNDIAFPKVNETPNNGDVLKYDGVYPLGKLVWGQADLAATSTIGVPGIPTNIYGDPVNVNGHSLEFIDDSLVPVDIGGIEQGSSFSVGSFNGQNWPLSEVIRKILYPYIPPKLEIDAFNTNTGFSYGDIGFTSSITITYSVTTFARESSEDLFDIEIQEDSNLIHTIGSFSGIPGSFTFSSVVISGTPSISPITFGIECSNIIDGFTSSTSATVSYEFVRPFLVFLMDESSSFIPDEDVANGDGIAPATLDTFLQEGTQSIFSKTLLPYENINNVIPMNIDVSGTSSYLYFAYPFEYPELTGIRSFSSGLISPPESYTYSITGTTASSPYGNYRIYKSLNPVIITNGLDKFQLLFSTNILPSFSSINDFWEINDSFDGYYISAYGDTFHDGIDLIRMSKISSNNNDYTNMFDQFSEGTIFRISYDGLSINYVILNIESNSLEIKITIQSIFGGDTLTAIEGDQIQFELLTL